jgi:NTE family protein
VDGGVSDNVGMRAVLDALEILQALHEAGQPTPLDNVRRVIVFIVNSLSSPPTNWDSVRGAAGHHRHPAQVGGTPIDAYSFEAVELLRDTAARWRTLRAIRKSQAFTASKDPAVAREVDAPDAEIYAIDVSFAQLKDKAELDFSTRSPRRSC